MKCKICELEFSPKNRIQKYCSFKCKSKADLNKRSKKPKTKKCSFCQKEFEPYTSLDKFCSSVCRIENVKSKRHHRWNDESVKRRMGAKNPAYRNGLRSGGSQGNSEGLRLFQKNRKEYDSEMIDAVGYLYCERCKKSGIKLESHHIIWRSEKPGHPNLHDKINILKVCVPCHNEFHKSKGLRNQIVNNRGLNVVFGQDILDK